MLPLLVTQEISPKNNSKKDHMKKTLKTILSEAFVETEKSKRDAISASARAKVQQIMAQRREAQKAADNHPDKTLEQGDDGAAGRKFRRQEMGESAFVKPNTVVTVDLLEQIRNYDKTVAKEPVQEVDTDYSYIAEMGIPRKAYFVENTVVKSETSAETINSLVKKKLANKETSDTYNKGNAKSEVQKDLNKFDKSLKTDAKNLPEETISESRYPSGPYGDQMSADSRNAYKEFDMILKSKGFKKAHSGKASAQEDHTWEHPVHGTVNIHGWHGTGKGNRDYGGVKQVQGLFHRRPDESFSGSQKHHFMSDPKDGTEDKHGMMTEKGVAVHKAHINKIKSYLHNIGKPELPGVKEEVEIDDFQLDESVLNKLRKLEISGGLTPSENNHAAVEKNGKIYVAFHDKDEDKHYISTFDVKKKDYWGAPNSEHNSKKDAIKALHSLKEDVEVLDEGWVDNVDKIEVHYHGPTGAGVTIHTNNKKATQHFNDAPAARKYARELHQANGKMASLKDHTK
jgi:hypothetical protein